jgi:hypothetical protein
LSKIKQNPWLQISQVRTVLTMQCDDQAPGLIANTGPWASEIIKAAGSSARGSILQRVTSRCM